MIPAVKEPVERPEAGRDYVLTDKQFATIAKLVRDEAGINLTEAKRDLVFSRLVKRLRRLAIPDFGAYIDLVGSPAGVEERRELISAITTNVTNFYREPHHFEHLAKTVIPVIQQRLAAGEPVRLWSAGSSDGREAYTMACTVLSAIPDAARRNLKILATDIDHKSLATAEAGQYSAEMGSRIPAATRDKYFISTADGVQVKPEVRDLVTFRTLNLMREWPFKLKFDVVFCRNVLIYFAPEVQATILSRFCTVMKPDAWLYIGHSERVSGAAAKVLRPEGITTYHHLAGGPAR